MQKRFVAVALCFVMVSAMAATTTVSAKQAGESSIRHYDIKFLPAAHGTPRVYGKLTVDEKTGRYVANGNLAKVGEKDQGKPSPSVPRCFLPRRYLR